MRRSEDRRPSGDVVLLGEEAEEDLVDLGAVRLEHAVRCVFDLDVFGRRQVLGELAAGGVDREDAVVGAVDRPVAS